MVRARPCPSWRHGKTPLASGCAGCSSERTATSSSSLLPTSWPVSLGRCSAEPSHIGHAQRRKRQTRSLERWLGIDHSNVCERDQRDGQTVEPASWKPDEGVGISVLGPLSSGQDKAVFEQNGELSLG